MGYPMTYDRVVSRNNLHGTYDNDNPSGIGLIRGDLRRLEADSRDDRHLSRYAEGAGITTEAAKKVLDMFFGDQA